MLRHHYPYISMVLISHSVSSSFLIIVSLWITHHDLKLNFCSVHFHFWREALLSLLIIETLFDHPWIKPKIFCFHAIILNPSSKFTNFSENICWKYPFLPFHLLHLRITYSLGSNHISYRVWNSPWAFFFLISSFFS